MKAILLAGGKGSRLRPLTNNLPKPMVHVMNRPLIERIIKRLKRNGIDEIILSVCYQPTAIKEYFKDGEHLGIKIRYIVEDTPLDTGGAIKKAAEGINETFFVFNSDILSDIDIQRMLRYHKQSGAVATIAVTRVENPSAYGVIEYDANSYALSFVEKPKPGHITSNYINAGTYIFEPEILKDVPENVPVSVERQIFPDTLQKGQKIFIYKEKNYWIDIGTIEKYMQLHLDILSGEYKSNSFKFNKERIFIDKTAKVDPDAKIIGPAYIGKNVVIGDKVHITNSVIGDNVKIGKGSVIADSILWDNINVGEEVTLFNSIVKSNCNVNERECVYYSIIVRDHVSLSGD